MNLILIAGKAGSGKDKVAGLFKEMLPLTIVTSFSKYIKMYSYEFGKWDLKEEHKPREFLQKMGDFLRNKNENFLVDRVKTDLEVYKAFGIKNVIISDVRLVHEITSFDELDYNVIKIRVNSNLNKRNLTKTEMQHVTEVNLDNYDKYDYVINNKYDENIYNDVLNIVKGIEEK